MKKKLEAPFAVVVVVVALFANGSHGSKQSENRTKNRAALFIFGDSLFDAGNNNYINTSNLDRANFWPYGETFFKFPTGRFSDGRLIPDFIAEFANLPLIEPYLQPGNKNYYNGVNFASAGAGALIQTFQGFVIPLRTQAKYFNKVERKMREELGRSEAKKVISKAIYLFSIGNNDYISPFALSSSSPSSHFFSSFTPSHYISMVIGNFTSVIQEIYKKGGRKFGVITCLPLGCLPGTRSLDPNGNGTCFQKLTQLSILHNTALSLSLSKLQKQLPGFKYSLYDLSTEATQRINHPSKFDNQANYEPYGENFFKYPSGRFSDGRVIPDFIAEYAELPLIQPYLFPGNREYINGVNFASGGSGALVETQQGLVIDLNTQLSHFKKVIKILRQKLEDEETKSLVARSVYLINIGPNDYFSSLTGNSSVITSKSPGNFVDMVIGNLTNVIKEIHNEGGRKFGFLTLGPLGCAPVVKALVNGSGPCREQVTELVKMHNNALALELKKLEKLLEGFKYSLTNLYDLGLQVMNDPSKYGFKEWGAACCGSGPYRGYPSCGGKSTMKDYELCENASEYFFFDYGHPTQRANELISQSIWNGNHPITGPRNLKSLFQQSSF